MRPSSIPCTAPCIARTRLGLVASLLVLLAAAPLAQVRKGDRHVDARFGFEVKVPKDWTSLPPPSGQSWVIGRYLSDKTFFYTEKAGWTYEFKPELTVIAFVSEELKKEARKALEEEEEKGYVPQRIEVESAYRDYKDYLAKTYVGGGFYYTREDPFEHDGLRVTILEAKVEKMAQTGPKRLVTWLFEIKDVDVAVQFEVLEQDFEDLSSLLDKTFKSFKVIPREGEMPILQGQAGGTFLSIEILEKMSPAERRQMRITQQEEAHRDAVQGLDDAWHHHKIGRFLVISKADEKYDERIAEQAEAVFRWLEETFPFVGEGEYVRDPILRICENWDEEWSYREAGGHDFRGLGLEITTNKEGGGTRSFEFEYVNRRVAEIWFNDRDRELWWAMPAWLKNGILGTVAEATAKRGKLDFYRDDWTMQTMRDLIRSGQATDPRTLVHLTDSAFASQEGAGMWGRTSEAKLLVEYLLVGAGAKRRESKDLIRRYVLHLDDVVAEMEEKVKEAEKDREPPKTEAEEEERFKAERQAWKQREVEILDEVGRRAFQGWTEKDWDAFAKSYFKSI